MRLAFDASSGGFVPLTRGARPWTRAEDARLRARSQNDDGEPWSHTLRHLPGRTAQQCKRRAGALSWRHRVTLLMRPLSQSLRRVWI